MRFNESDKCRSCAKGRLSKAHPADTADCGTRARLLQRSGARLRGVQAIEVCNALFYHVLLCLIILVHRLLVDCFVLCSLGYLYNEFPRLATSDIRRIFMAHGCHLAPAYRALRTLVNNPDSWHGLDVHPLHSQRKPQEMAGHDVAFEREVLFLRRQVIFAYCCSLPLLLFLLLFLFFSAAPVTLLSCVVSLLLFCVVFFVFILCSANGGNKCRG